MFPRQLQANTDPQFFPNLIFFGYNQKNTTLMLVFCSILLVFL